MSERPPATFDLRSASVPALGPEDHVRGELTAPLVIVYADFTCPRCALAHERLSTVSVRRVFRHFALRAGHSRARALAAAAEAAGRQGAFWAMHDALFADPAHGDDPHLWERVRHLGLDLARFESDRHDPAIADRLARDLRGGLRAGVACTPTLFALGRAHPGPPAGELLAELARAPSHAAVAGVTVR